MRRLLSPFILLLFAIPAVGGHVLAQGRPPAEPPLYIDRTTEWGLDFTHRSGATGRLLMPEMMGPGAALLDYDFDGDLDVYLIQGRSLAPGNLDESGIPRPDAPIEDRLFRDDRGPEGALRLVDVSREALPEPDGGYGMGVAVGDLDDDGHLDLARTAFGPDLLLRNAGDGTFLATSDPDRSWSMSATFVDLDGDGDLDLFVVRYLDYSLAEPPDCYSDSSRPDYCGPSDLIPARDRLLLNQGGGRMVDASDLIPGDAAPGLGVAAIDGDLDGRPEVFVANDGTANHLWRWVEGQGLQDLGEMVGVAYNQFGQPEASMGIAIGDVDGNPLPDLFVTHLAGETDTLYVNESDLFFDRTLEYGLGPPSLPWTGFGTAWVDADLDGRQDLVVLHGAVRLPEKATLPGPRALAQPPQLLLRSGARFSAAPSYRLDLPDDMVGRGLAVGDLDGDGHEDLLAIETEGPARLLAARPPEGGRWLAVRAERRPGTPAHGASVSLTTASGERATRWVGTDGSYLSARDHRVVFGLGSTAPARLEIRWPSGSKDRWVDPPSGKTLVMQQHPEAPPG